MASCSSRKNKNNPSMFCKAERPCFFKIILEKTARQTKMALPWKFARNYGDHLWSSVTLNVPSGAKWKVDIVTSDDGRIWFQNGWSRFVEYYDITHGSFLVFQYDKSNGEFNVTIFDRTATEIHYPFNKTGIPDEISRKRKKESLLSSSRPYKKMKKAETFTKITEKGTYAQAKKENQSLRFRSEIPTFEIKMQPSYVNYCRSSLTIPVGFRRKYMKKEDGDALLVLNARTWSVKYYTALVSGFKRTRFTNYGWKVFAQKNHLEVGDVCKFELIDPHKTLFRVVISRSSSGENAGRSKKLSDMKEHFPKPSLSNDETDSMLQSGDSEQSKEKESCSKQPNLSSDCLKRCRVGRPCNISNANHTRKMIKLQHSVGQVEGRKNTKERSNFISGNHTFQIIMKPSNLDSQKYTLPVPRKFAKIVEQGSHHVKLQVDNKLWSVKLNNYPYAGVFCEGWIEFSRQNSLKLGDVCTFKLINNTDQTLLMNVSIFRGSGRCLIPNGVHSKVELQVPKVEETTSEIPDEDFGQILSSRKRKEQSTLSSSQPRKKMKMVEN